MTVSNAGHDFDDAPPLHRKQLLALRSAILKAANAAGVGPIEECFKWGEPAFVPPRREGTTLRLGQRPSHCAVLVHCQTNLVDQWREQFADTFEYEGNRAALIPLDGKIDDIALEHLLVSALTYHRAKRKRA